MLRLVHLLLILFIVAFSLGLWSGIGYGIAWILDVGLSVDVNYKVFVIVGFVIGSIKSVFVLLAGIFQNLMLKKF